ncbi:MAG: hypothetical protein WC401_02710 [Bacteroidales bacterium]|jgi:hypothetical protein
MNDNTFIIVVMLLAYAIGFACGILLKARENVKKRLQSCKEKYGQLK